MSDPTWTNASIKYQQRAFGIHDRFFDVAEDSLAAWRKVRRDCEDFDTALRGKA